MTALELCQHRDALIRSAVVLVDEIKKATAALAGFDATVADENRRACFEQLHAAVTALGNITLSAVRIATDRALTAVPEQTSERIH